MDAKLRLRKSLRSQRQAYVDALPPQTKALLFLRPPRPITDAIGEGSIVGLYHSLGAEAPTQRYAEWFYENGRRIALPFFTERDSPMQFRLWDPPYGDEGLVKGPYGALQPHHDAPQVTPDTIFVPLLAFTADRHRLGQGGGHYDRWIADHGKVPAYGMAWDCQLIDTLPLEPHDQPLTGVITPTRLFEGQA